MLSGKSYSESNAQGTWYISTSAGDDSNDCQSPLTPCLSIPNILNKPTFVEGDVIRITSGSFPISNQPFALILSKSVTLSGGWDSSFSSLNGFNTSIKGDFGGIQIEEGVDILIENFTVHGDMDFAIENDGELYGINTRVWSDNYDGIQNNGTIILTTTRLKDNFGSALINSGTAILSDTTVTDNSGSGIVNSGIMTITNSVISEHNNWFASGVVNHGTITIRDTAIVDNYIIYTTSGAGLYNTGNATLINTTISGNTGAVSSQGGGIYNGGSGTITLYNSTIAFNGAVQGAGVFNSVGGVVMMQNSILASNGGATGNCTGDPIQSLGYNLIDDTSGCAVISNIGDLLDVPALIFPVNGYAQSFPANEETLFAPLAFSSPAVNGGDPAGCFDDQGNPLLTDQRGLPRTGACDIGAYEYIAAFDPLVYLWLPATLRFSP